MRSPDLRKGLLGGLLVVLALVLWTVRDPVAAWFASSYVATIELRTTGERDDARVQRAFAAAQAAQRADATFELLPGLTLIRHSAVHVSGPSRAAAIAAAQALSQAILDAFNTEGPGELEARLARRIDPVPGAGSHWAAIGLAAAALVLALGGIGALWLAWRGLAWRARPAAFAGLGASEALGGIALVALPVLILVLPGWLFMALFAMAIPSTIAGSIVWKMHDVQRAARWPSAQARIVRSRLRAVHRQGSGEATTVGNVPEIEYVFSVEGVEYRGHRIGVGEIAADSPEARAAVERYTVGRTAPVFYNPANPREAVLERDAPASATVMYGIAAGVMLVGLAIVVTFTRAGEVIAWLQPFFPPGAFVPGVLFFAAAGLLMTLFLIASLRRSLASARWPTASGKVLSSIAEPHASRAADGRSAVWSPVVEYSYRVAGRDYHGSRIAFGGDVAGSRDFAQAIADRYPAGHQVIVHFDPDNPGVAVLEPRVAFAWLTLFFTVAFFAAAWFFAR
jgi:hypothetical protein